MSIRVGICHNRLRDLNLIKDTVKHFVDETTLTCSVDYFSRKQEAYELKNNASVYDIIFMDLDIKDYDVMKIARDIADMAPLVNLIFITENAELLFEAVKSRPFRVLRRQMLDEELEEAVDAVINKIVAETVMCDYEYDDREAVKVNLLDVDYIECEGHYLNVHSAKNDIQIRAKISDYEEKLKEYGFIRIHRGYLANVRSIYSINSKQISLDNGEILPVSRKNSDVVRHQYNDLVKKYIRSIER